MPTIQEKAIENIERAEAWAKEIARQFEEVKLDWITGTMAVSCIMRKGMENILKEAYVESTTQLLDAAMFISNIGEQLKKSNMEVMQELQRDFFKRVIEREEQEGENIE